MTTVIFVSPYLTTPCKKIITDLRIRKVPGGRCVRSKVLFGLIMIY